MPGRIWEVNTLAGINPLPATPRRSLNWSMKSSGSMNSEGYRHCRNCTGMEDCCRIEPRHSKKGLYSGHCRGTCRETDIEGRRWGILFFHAGWNLLRLEQGRPSAGSSRARCRSLCRLILHRLTAETMTGLPRSCSRDSRLRFGRRRRMTGSNFRSRRLKRVRP